MPSRAVEAVLRPSPRLEALEPLLARAGGRAARAAEPSGTPKNAEAHTLHQEPTVAVTIGRLEVRTQPLTLERPPPTRAPRRRPSSLDDYLRARSSGRGG